MSVFELKQIGHNGVCSHTRYEIISRLQLVDVLWRPNFVEFGAIGSIVLAHEKFVKTVNVLAS
jgi:hypothetical protein